LQFHGADSALIGRSGFRCVDKSREKLLLAASSVFPSARISWALIGRICFKLDIGDWH
jgi:hypothetical protein